MQQAINSVAMMPHGPFCASGGDDLSLRLWDLSAMEEVHSSRVRFPIVSVVTNPMRPKEVKQKQRDVAVS